MSKSARVCAGHAWLTSPTSSSDIWVVLEIGNDFSLPVKASQSIVPDRRTSSYTFPSADLPGAAIKLVLSSQTSSLEAFEELLTDYCAFQSDAKGKGTLELMDEKGQMLGTIDGPWRLEEDAGMHKPGHEKDPVLVELPDENAKYQPDQAVTVTAAPRDGQGAIPASYQNDWLLRGASIVSKTLVDGEHEQFRGLCCILTCSISPQLTPLRINLGRKTDAHCRRLVRFQDNATHVQRGLHDG